MNLIQAKNIYKEIILFIRNNEIKNAIDKTIEMATGLQNWSISDKATDIETNYKYMIHYFVEGQNDPEQDNVYKHIVRSIYTLADELLEHINIKESPTIFFEKSRIANIHSNIEAEDYLSSFMRLKDSLSITDLMPDGDDKSERIRRVNKEKEEISKNIFYSIFASPRADDLQINTYKNIFNAPHIHITTKSMMVSALTLNILQRFDKRKIDLLLDLCNNKDIELSIRAIVGLLPIIRQFNNRLPYYPQLTNRIELMIDDSLFENRLMIAIIQFIQAHETEKITKKLNEEILPEMMKLSPLIGNKISPEEWLGETDMDDKNPEWQKILDEAGLSDKIKEFTEMQLGGADILHSTFSNLKNYPFFNEMSNWFIPFDKQHTSLQQMSQNQEDKSDILSSMLGSSMMCNSDKYSFCFSIMQMPEQYRKMIASQIGAEGDELKRMAEEELVLNPNQKEEALCKQYVQDLYRFYKLYRRKDNFDDIFAKELDFHLAKSLINIISKPDNIKKIALHYFEKNNFKEALEAYSILSEIESNNSETWQKIGYCKQINNNIKGALKAYQKAELLDDNNSWILRRIGSCLRLLNEPESALQYYKRLENLRPDDLNIQLNIGHCFLELEQYEEALNYYFKVDFLSNENTRAWRSIAWSSFLSNKYDTAQRYYNQIINNKPNSQDFLNAGHVELCMGNKKMAVERYTSSAKMINSFDKFKSLFNEDKDILIKIGIEAKSLPLIFDKIRYDM